MTIENSNNRDRLTSDGVIVDFDFTFKIYDDTQIKVYIIDNNDDSTLKTLTTDYTVAISTTTEGGTVTFITSPTDTYEVLMVRNIPYTQSADIPVNEGFSEVIIENALDRLAIQIQQINDILDKTIRIEETSTVTSLTFADPESEKLIRWKSDLSGFENILLTDISAIEADITIATGDAKKVVNVNALETGYELSTVQALIELIVSGTLTINTDFAVTGTLDVTGITTMGSIFKFKKGADVASAGALTLGDDGNFFDITGTTNITSITAKTAGTAVMLQFDGALTVTDGSNLKIRGDFPTAAESSMMLVCDGTNWVELSRSIEADDLAKDSMVKIWSGAVSAIPSGYVICDGANSTPNLEDRFVIHADADSGGTNDVGDTGGASTHAISLAELAVHAHVEKINGEHATGNGTNVEGSDNNIAAATTSPAVSTADAGSGSAHTNRDKFYALAYVMKT